MANEQQVQMLKQGAEAWNTWRDDNLAAELDLRGADFRGARLEKTNLEQADLRGADLRGADLRGARLEKTNLERADLRDADLSGAVLSKATLDGANLSGANLSGVDLYSANLLGANLSAANLQGADLFMARLHRATLVEANLREAYLFEATLNFASLRGADLSGANLVTAQLGWADLQGAKLQGADLRGAHLVGTCLKQADLSKCKVYGISVWDVVLDAETQQHDLVITDQESITVDDLEIAQFIYLLLRNEKLRHVIDTITSKVVLILGRFTPDRKPVLDALREELRKRDRLPVIFDFDVPGTRDTHETLTTLARMARFVVADITDPKSVPQELVSIVEQLPSVPVHPILQEGSEPWGMYDHIKRYPWVLPVLTYSEPAALIARLDELVITPLEVKVKEIRG